MKWVTLETETERKQRAYLKQPLFWLISGISEGSFRVRFSFLDNLCRAGHPLLGRIVPLDP